MQYAAPSGGTCSPWHTRFPVPAQRLQRSVQSHTSLPASPRPAAPFRPQNHSASHRSSSTAQSSSQERSSAPSHPAPAFLSRNNKPAPTPQPSASSCHLSKKIRLPAQKRRAALSLSGFIDPYVTRHFSHATIDSANDPTDSTKQETPGQL